MTKHSKSNESNVRTVRKESKSKLTTIPRCIVDKLNIQNTDILSWNIVDGKIVIEVIR
jgi:hypothetical protein